MSGKNYKLFISDDGTDAGVKTEVEFQGDLTLTEGKPLTRTAYKNATKTAQGADGRGGSILLGIQTPAPAGQALLVAASDSGNQTYIWIEGTNTGDYAWEGPVIWTINEWPMNTDGEFEVTAEFGEDGEITRSVVA